MSKSPTESKNYSPLQQGSKPEKKEQYSWEYLQLMNQEKMKQAIEQENRFCESLNNEILLLEKEIVETVQAYTPHRAQMIDLIEKLASESFTHVDTGSMKIEMYGSLSQGIAIESSDMDLVITGIKCFGDKAVLTSRLSVLFDSLQQNLSSELLSNAECITGTDFPLIKLVRIPHTYLIEHFYQVPGK